MSKFRLQLEGSEESSQKKKKEPVKKRKKRSIESHTSSKDNAKLGVPEDWEVVREVGTKYWINKYTREIR